MTPSAPPNSRRRVPIWVWIVLGVVVAVALVAWPIITVAAGIGAKAATDEVVVTDADRARAADKAFTERDPVGSKACDLLDMQLGGIGSWTDVAAAAKTAATPGIKTATDPDGLYAACVAAGANMSPKPTP